MLLALKYVNLIPMKAVITSGNKQYLVAEKETLLVDKLPEDEKELTFDALLTIDGDKVKVGAPTVDGVKVTAKVVDPLVKGEKTRAIRYHAFWRDKDRKSVV